MEGQIYINVCSSRCYGCYRRASAMRNKNAERNTDNDFYRYMCIMLAFATPLYGQI